MKEDFSDDSKMEKEEMEEDEKFDNSEQEENLFSSGSQVEDQGSTPLDNDPNAEQVEVDDKKVSLILSQKGSIAEKINQSNPNPSQTPL